MITQTDLVARFNLLEQTAQYDALLQEIDAYMNDNPDLQPLYFYKGNALRYKGDMQGALAAYRWSILLDPNDIKARTNYAATLFDLKDYVGALNAADAAILMEPDIPDPFLICGNVLSLLGFPEQAMYPFHHAFELMPDNLSLGSYVAELYSQHDEPEDAFNLMMQLLEKDEKNMSLQLQMATMLCFFMQNGVSLKDVENWATKWADEHRSAFSAEVRTNIMQHNLKYSPLTLDNLRMAFDAQIDSFDASAEEEAIAFINLLENAMQPYFQGRKDLHVVDVGCGTGLSISPAREYTTEGFLTGVDISSGLLSVAQRKKIYNELKQGEALEYLSGKKEQFDVIIAANSLPYFEDLDKVFACFNQALKQKGMVFFSIKNNGLNSEDKILYPVYNYLFSSKYVRDMLSKNGFVVRSSTVMVDGSDEIIHDKKHFYVIQKA